jgi:hypothetical protein
MPSGYTTATTSAIIPNVAVIYRDISSTSTPIGLSRGGITFAPNPVWTQFEFDGRRSDIEALHRITGWDATISGTLLELTNVNFSGVLEPSSSVTTGTATPTVVTITPQPASTFLTATTDYLINLTMQFTRGDSKIIKVIFAKALCTKYDIVGTDPDGGIVNVEFKAVLDATAAASSTDTCPYVITVTG